MVSPLPAPPRFPLISLPSKIHTLFLLRKQAPKKSKSNKIKTSKPGKD